MVEATMAAVKNVPIALAAAVLTACGQPPAASDRKEQSLPAGNPAPSESATVMPATQTPPALTREAERGAKGARNVLLAFTRSLESGRFGLAWAMLNPNDQRKWSESDFAGLFADLTGITVAVPTGTMEGAAGSSYYAAPVAITAIARDGRPVRMEGQAVLRRVNDIEGATAQQLKWHFESLTLDWTH